MRIFTAVKALIVCLLLVSCSSVKQPVSVEQARAQAPSYPQKEYVIQPGDTLDVKFFYNPELNELLVTVRPDGRISLQLAPGIMAAGLTPEQLADELTKAY